MKKKTKEKTADEFRISVRTTADELDRLRQTAKNANIKQADLVRIAVSEKIAELNARIQRGETLKMELVAK
jgi:hypothetical protein